MAMAAGGIAQRAAAPIFTLALFSSAALIFALQPLVGRLVTPLLGGSPAVWNTSMVFFQAALLAGYVYAHALARLRDLRVQAVIHALVLALAWFVLPVHVTPLLGPPNPEQPAFWLLGVLTLSVGAPFAAAAATAPLLQAWYARTGRADAHDPYYLYAASNLGSFAALVAYPIVIEPFIGLREQAEYWGFAYLGVVVLILAAGAMAVAARAPAPENQEAGAAPPWRERLYWMAAAAIPSSLILGATQHISTDIASAPFLWVAPLALYLLTFVIAFARGSERFEPFALILHPLALAFLVGSYFERSNILLPLAGNLVAFFLSALVCHFALARTRPHVGRLTEFYFWVSAGGVLGGALTALVAPLIFNDIYEYPLALAAVALFRPRRTGDVFPSLATSLAAAAVTMAVVALALLRHSATSTALFAGGVGAAGALLGAALPASATGALDRRRMFFLAAALVLAALMTYALFRSEALVRDGDSVELVQPFALVVMGVAFLVLVFVVQATIRDRGGEGDMFDLAADIALGAALAGVTVILTLTLLEDRFTRGLVIVLGLGAVAAALFFNRTRPYLMAVLVLVGFVVVFARERGPATQIIAQERSFFGVLRTEELHDLNPESPVLRILMHGTTIHGAQLQGGGEYSRQPLTYYNSSTALGEAILSGLSGGETSSLALIGLGTGSTACLMRQTDRLDIFEIDPAVVRLAGPEGRMFSFVSQCQPEARIVLGDARLMISQEPDRTYDVIVVDAFSSDAIPAHLLTREAVAAYLSKTTDRGVVVLHLSNRHLALVAEAARVAHDLNAPFVWRISQRVSGSMAFGGLPASVMILARDPDAIAHLPLASMDWRELPAPPGRAWSDDYINLPRALYESLTDYESCLEEGRAACGAEDAPRP